MTDRALFECDALGDSRVVAIRATEAINALPRWTVDVIVDGAEPDFDELIGAPAYVAIRGDEVLEAPRVASLVITAVSYLSTHREGHVYRCELSAPPVMLEHVSSYRIFQNKTTQEIVELVLTEAGVGGAHLSWHLTETYFERVHCTQYGETTWAFVERLLADEGISYWFDVRDTEWVMLLSDHTGAHEEILGEAKLRFNDEAGALHAPGAVHELELERSWATSSTHVRAFDVLHPDVLIEGKEGKGPFEHFEYPIGAPNAAAAAIRAKVRLQQLRRFAMTARATTGCARVGPGRSFTLEGVSDDDHGIEYLVVGVEHELAEPTPGDTHAAPYVNRALLVPKTDVPFRPDLPAEVPRVEGLQTAITRGPKGEEIHVDPLGRVKLAMRWDAKPGEDDTSSSWVRAMQNNMSGAMILPRVGWEVAVAFDHGDPDRPVALGRLYNPETAVPYGLPGAKATTSIKSNTSPGAGSVNEVKLADDAGQEAFAVSASRDLSLMVGDAAKWLIGNDLQHGVDLGHETHVHGGLSATIGGSLAVDVAKDIRLEVEGTKICLVAGPDLQHITGDRKVSVKTGHAEICVGLHGIQCNQENTAVIGPFTQVVGGVLAHAAALGTGEVIVGWRKEKAQSRKVTAVLAATEGGKFCTSVTINAAAVKEKADAGHAAIDAKSMSVTAGSAKLEATKDFAIECDELFIKCPHIHVDNGATLTITSTTTAAGGKTALKAPDIKKTAGEEAHE